MDSSHLWLEYRPQPQTSLACKRGTIYRARHFHSRKKLQDFSAPPDPRPPRWRKEQVCGAPANLESFAIAPPSVQEILVGNIPPDMISEYARKAAEYFTSLAESPSKAQMLAKLAATATLSPAQQRQIAKVLEQAKHAATPKARKTA